MRFARDGRHLSAESRNPESSRASRGEVLIIEDTAGSLKLLTELLRRAGYVVRPANDGSLGLASAMRRAPDLVLLDIRMPGIDGFEVCRRLKAEPRTREVPVVFLSASQEPVDKLQGFRLGGVDFITKPYQSEEVLARVQTHIQLFRLQQKLEERVRARTAQFEQANQALLDEVAEHQRAEADLAKSNRAFRTLSECYHVVAHAVDERQLLLEFCRIVKECGGYSHAWLRLAGEDAAQPLGSVAQASFDARSTDSEPGRSALAAALRSGQPASEPLSPAQAMTGAEAAAIPLVTGDKRLGEMMVYPARPGVVVDDELRLLREVAASLVHGLLLLHARDELRESEKRFRVLFEQAAVGVAEVETRTGRYIRVNQRFCDIVGYSREELLESDSLCFTQPEDFELELEQRHRLAREGFPGHF